MNARMDLSNLSIDELIQTMRQWRSRDPESSLIRWLEDHLVSTSRLVDLVCIDLIQRRRMGQRAVVEDYVADFPALSDDDAMLDVIDAEVCVTVELGMAVDRDSYLKRFPRLAGPIDELLQLNEQVGAAPAAVGSSFQQSSATSRSEGSTVLTHCAADADDGLPDKLRCIETPDWFVGGRCVASGNGIDSTPQHWLVRGRDKLRGINLAMKVIQLPATWQSDHTTWILDSCEAASSVSHPAWVRPILATVQGPFLAVIRPWVFAATQPIATGHWKPRLSDAGLSSAAACGASADSASEVWARIARVAFALAAAHRVNVTHGAVHAGNLMVDQQGNVNLVDAVAGHHTIPRWLDSGDPSVGVHDFRSPMIVQQQKACDVDDLLELVAVTMVGMNPARFDDVFGRIHQAAADEPDQPCAAIGDAVMRFISDPPDGFIGPLAERPTRWRSRASQWWKSRMFPKP
ncbi:hypothetical protein K227x_01030 [Rubripirellula lacrimiformis]|uniref:Protein kinase domain-containing protein n=1 Tax=Rubripirellula lacrimiformis TaxID=1930273 RepID=A0A517N3N8_9BACT|nr:hypothetical protein [Rubripirellula lacrimiformis]QDT01736.1 hypothetical protein K227x_01030 [Rubripirellula lacrimiformis]